MVNACAIYKKCRIARQTPFSGFHEVLRPFVVDALRDPLTTTQLSNAILAPQAIQDDPDLLFG